MPFFKDFWEKIAALGISLVRNHGFVDGNKRVGFAVMAVLLERRGYRITSAIDENVRMTISIAASQMERDEVADWLRNNSAPI